MLFVIHTKLKANILNTENSEYEPYKPILESRTV